MIRTILTFVLFINCFILSSQIKPMYIGTYTSNGSEGVYIYNFNEDTGEADFVKSISMSNPSFLARNSSILYAVNENVNGGLTAYDIDKAKLLNEMSTDGAHPCHVSVSPEEPVVVVSNYSGGSLVLYSINDDGSIKRQEDFLKFEKSSINKERQTKSHVHSAFFSKDGQYLFVSDLGGDLIYKILIDKQDSGYTFNLLEEIKVKSGGGPRHVVISDDAKRLYVVLELTGELEVLEQGMNGWVSQQIVPIYSDGFAGAHGAADIKMSSDGKYIYTTNRGTSNEIAAYKVLKNGTLKLEQVLPVEGNSPRNVQLSPNNKWVIVSNQLSGSVSFFKRNSRTGKLSSTAHKLSIPSPVCVVF